MATAEALPEIDGTAGTLVWVRRRNGSWWPGRILGAEELASSHLMSPRSGTPVKLLGREDASVDWYNFEKSKRVKPFRCGEFDACIERAEAIQGNPLRKREKYARREDAILHALELERLQRQMARRKSGFVPRHTGFKNSLSLNLHESDEVTDAFNFDSLKAVPFSKKFSSYEDEDVDDHYLYLEREKYMEQHGSEDGNSEMFQRMRGLQDIGLKSSYSKRKFTTPGTLVNADDIVPPNHFLNSQNSSTGKGKRSHSGPLEESFVKKRDRRRPLVQVLQSSANFPSFEPSTTHDDVCMSMKGEGVGALHKTKMSQCIYYPADNYTNKMAFSPQEMHTSDLFCNKNSFSRLSEDEGFDWPGNVATNDMTEKAGSGRMLARVPSNSGHGASKEQILGPNGITVPMLTHGSRPHYNEQDFAVAANMRGSKWQLKGKRNGRVALKKPLEMIDTNHSSSTERYTDQDGLHEGEVNMLKKRTSQRALGGGVYRRKDDPIYDYYYDDDDDGDDEEDDDGEDEEDYDEDDDDDDDCYEVDGDDVSMENAFISKMHNIGEMTSDDDITDSDEYSESGLRGYWGVCDTWFDPYYGAHLGVNRNNVLVDVDLKVQVSYRKEQVPLISLMSGLNGKAVVGRPLQVEKLEDGSLQLPFPGYGVDDGSLAYDDDDDDDDEDYDDAGSSGFQSVWPTARRTVMHRVPRSRPSTAFGTEKTDYFQHPDNMNWSNPNSSSSSFKGAFMKNPHSSYQGRSSDGKFLKKQSKKICLSSQKTRTLSSIASERRFMDTVTKEALCDRPVKVDRLNTRSCIPVKSVFSRINEAVGKVTCMQETVGNNGVSAADFSNNLNASTEQQLCKL